jgi:hypothetical protein
MVHCCTPHCLPSRLLLPPPLQGLTLTFEEITSVFTRSPQLLLLGMVSGQEAAAAAVMVAAAAAGAALVQ